MEARPSLILQEAATPHPNAHETAALTGETWVTRTMSVVRALDDSSEQSAASRSATAPSDSPPPTGIVGSITHAGISTDERRTAVPFEVPVVDLDETVFNLRLDRRSRGGQGRRDRLSGVDGAYERTGEQQDRLRIASSLCGQGRARWLLPANGRDR